MEPFTVGHFHAPTILWPKPVTEDPNKPRSIARRPISYNRNQRTIYTPIPPTSPRHGRKSPIAARLRRKGAHNTSAAVANLGIFAALAQGYTDLAQIVIIGNFSILGFTTTCERTTWHFALHRGKIWPSLLFAVPL